MALDLEKGYTPKTFTDWTKGIDEPEEEEETERDTSWLNRNT